MNEHTNYLGTWIRRHFQGVRGALDKEDGKNEQSFPSPPPQGTYRLAEEMIESGEDNKLKSSDGASRMDTYCERPGNLGGGG